MAITLTILGVDTCKNAHFAGKVSYFTKFNTFKMSKMLQFHWFRAFLNITLAILDVDTCKNAHFAGNVSYFMKWNTYKTTLMKKDMSKILQCHWFRAYLTISLSILCIETCKKDHFKENMPYFMKMNTFSHLKE